jgi:predicted  nucleic acid-binding Zn-ribbon protein
MSEHEEQADRLEHEADQMEERSEHLEAEISGLREDWERKKRDGSVPGAGGDPEAAEQDLPPEANYTSRGGEDH